ncbi:hypothetical protein I7I50_01177 [Histoplasma capsulatum G186AR]|uniref:Uncharacterized protein n=1 Tax=Ajellomyces capsulatus TaxID=5037 RepID=A0A8H8D269_AJECA|nr:hypothetical protein I7I52_08996 [Histoplasma capsulatum]QSS73127.1 hypothetical protein I7I50_01177 [Histoplasma capsulatum G186AR]
MTGIIMSTNTNPFLLLAYYPQAMSMIIITILIEVTNGKKVTAILNLTPTYRAAIKVLARVTTTTNILRLPSHPSISSLPKIAITM